MPFTGLEWSFRFKDEGYDCDGYRNAVARRGVSLNPNQEDESDEDEDVEMIQITSLADKSVTEQNEGNQLLVSQ